jgi:hypothetical protein
LLFGEAQARVVISTSSPEAVLAAARSHGVPAQVIGRVTDASEGVDFLIGAVSAHSAIAPLARAFHDTIPGIMNGDAAATADGASASPTTV